MCGPWKLFRVVSRIVLCTALAWFFLALLWAFLPFPTTEHDGDNGVDYPTAVLRAGKGLTRVYDSSHFRIPRNDRQGFAIDYMLDVENLTIDIGSSKPLPIRKKVNGNVSKRTNAPARIGDTDGANLPWFPFADSILLYSWIHKEESSVPLMVHWTGELDTKQRMELYVARHREDDHEDHDVNSHFTVSVNAEDDFEAHDLILRVEIQGEDRSTINVTVPEIPLSSSPSRTYPIRFAILHIIAPTAVFVNNLLGNAIGAIIQSMVNAILVVLGIGLYGFILLAIVFSLWKCLKGPSFEDTTERIQSRLDRLSHNERLRFLKIDTLRGNLDVLYQNKRFRAALNICRNGWHPERDRATADEEEAADTEKRLGTDEGKETEEDMYNKK